MVGKQTKGETKMKDYKIKRSHRTGENYETMIIIDRATGEERAEFRLTNAASEIAAMRRALNKHFDDGGTFGNYQF
jgi:hypothetical protein